MHAYMYIYAYICIFMQSPCIQAGLNDQIPVKMIYLIRLNTLPWVFSKERNEKFIHLRHQYVCTDFSMDFSMDRIN